MRTLVSANLSLQIDNFYRFAMQKHITLTETIVEAKKNRLLEELESL